METESDDVDWIQLAQVQGVVATSSEQGNGHLEPRKWENYVTK
jgi:hypothetical protein